MIVSIRKGKLQRLRRVIFAMPKTNLSVAAQNYFV